MPDGARSGHAGVQAQLDRLMRLSPGADVLGLDRIGRLLNRLGDPQERLPPVFHVAGTNGKGSTCAFLRAGLEAAGYRVHAYTSPHLVRFNERIRLAGRLIEDEALADLLAEVLAQADGIGASFFEITTAAAFLAFERVPADACVIEVGLGGRLDATNLVRPVATAIAQLGVDHQAFLGETATAIAAEKAGIAKPGVPLVTMRYPADVADVVARAAEAVGAPLLVEGRNWRFDVAADGVRLTDAEGVVALPLPALPGPHQAANLALAAAMLRSQGAVLVPDAALARAAAATWPARMQRLSARGPLAAMLPPGAELRLDGGHNAPAAAAVVRTATALAAGRPVHLVAGVMANKDATALLAPLASLAGSFHAVPVPGHDHHAPDALARLATRLGFPGAEPAADLAGALGEIARATQADTPPFVLILGSLYLAGEALERNGEPPQ